MRRTGAPACSAVAVRNTKSRRLATNAAHAHAHVELATPPSAIRPPVWVSNKCPSIYSLLYLSIKLLLTSLRGVYGATQSERVRENGVAEAPLHNHYTTTRHPSSTPLSQVNPADLPLMKAHQRVNKFPKSSALTLKVGRCEYSSISVGASERRRVGAYDCGGMGA